jgi:hypothetical protein
VNQQQFNDDLNINFDDTGDFMQFPEQEEGFRDNPIRRLFEQDEDLDVEE